MRLLPLVVLLVVGVVAVVVWDLTASTPIVLASNGVCTGKKVDDLHIVPYFVNLFV